MGLNWFGIVVECFWEKLKWKLTGIEYLFASFLDNQDIPVKDYEVIFRPGKDIH